jgi:hypothetical protein
MLGKFLTAAQGRAEGQKKQMPDGPQSQRQKKQPKTQTSQAELQVLVSCTAVTFRSKSHQKSYEINAADAKAKKHRASCVTSQVTVLLDAAHQN